MLSPSRILTQVARAWTSNGIKSDSDSEKYSASPFGCWALSDQSIQVGSLFARTNRRRPAEPNNPCRKQSFLPLARCAIMPSALGFCGKNACNDKDVQVN